MTIYLVRNRNGEFLAADGEGYTGLLRFAAVFLVLTAAELVARDTSTGAVDDRVATMDHTTSIEVMGVYESWSMRDLVQAAWNTALRFHHYQEKLPEGDWWLPYETRGA